MVILQGDHFKLEDGRIYTLLCDAPTSGLVYIIDVEDSKAFPKEAHYASLLKTATRLTSEDHQNQRAYTTQTATPAQLALQARAWEIIAPLTTKPGIFTPGSRWSLVAARARAKELSCSPSNILTQLRRYWQGGQTKAALLGHYPNCGRINEYGTGARGRPATKPGSGNFHATAQDHAHYRQAIEKYYLKDARATAEGTLHRLWNDHYTYLDGNGVRHLRPAGERPTIRQFSYFLKNQYSVEWQIRHRKGDKEFERNHRQVLGTAMQICEGVGHIFEMDATLVDCTLVSRLDRADIIGRPTLYYIIDRSSRLIVGWYIGLENPSWQAALLAIFSIAEDKEKLCEQLGIPYAPEDWPAHGIFPQQLFVDRGEGISKEATKLCEGTRTTVTNIPALRPDWKPFVEGSFRLTHLALAAIEPSYSPAAEAFKRRGPEYPNNACLTLDEFERILVKNIIIYNQTIQKSYALSMEQIRDRIEPSPINLWNHGVISRAGQLARHAQDALRLSLWPSDFASVSEKGIEFSGLFYKPESVDRSSWFVEGRKVNMQVQMSHDLRLVDRIYVHDPKAPNGYFTAVLSPKSSQFAGMSLKEAKHMLGIEEELKGGAIQSRGQGRIDLINFSDPIGANAKTLTHEAKKGVSNSGRRKNTVSARATNLTHERKESASSQHPGEHCAAANSSTPVTPAPQGTNVVPIRPNVPIVPAAPTGTPSSRDGKANLKDLARFARQQLSQ